ncbi:bifunctional adenosylcobinamide kinase/adenosylcobinamide-phosphate guanylyltransferase [Sutcliffiella horikoshii]|uniref:bifunctional adenosylcobinamide kinase/adenosylcobinamide-phosphate guanylyltransferase n=1 Tax=Sutcliffiella horikoshii TaxID=79883 RepID=UPI001CBBBDB6|nr:bifunctional adenosylcobinamide kinase/adenosylcobinamide-phosphate guanylyltransferase [Sutcliffiella horikoshii]UAL45517.1 bifunctional adenosylcobinamide kinase/adenosylcobinamide-phosphate guanylyltransferase [Sutcliffiella horikoshii]
MQLIIGGAFSGKRSTVRTLHSEELSWVSAYDEHSMTDWKSQWESDTSLVLEGWEQWIMNALPLEQDDDSIRQFFYSFLLELKEEERKRGKGIVLIMLEMGRGIVPVEKQERRLRDLAGWFSQDAAKLADEVYYVWHGMKEQLK